MGASNIFSKVSKPAIPYCFGATKKMIGDKIDQWNEENPDHKINGAMTLLAQEIYVKFCQGYNKGLFTGKYIFSTNNIELASWTRMSDRTIRRHIKRFLEVGILTGKTNSKNAYSNFILHLDKSLLVFSRVHETAWKDAGEIKNTIIPLSPSPTIELEEEEELEFDIADLKKVIKAATTIGINKANVEKTKKPVEKPKHEFSANLDEFIQKNTKQAKKEPIQPKKQRFLKKVEKPLPTNNSVYVDKMSAISSSLEPKELKEPLKEHVDKWITSESRSNQGQQKRLVKNENYLNKQSGRSQQLKSFENVFREMSFQKEKTCAKKEKGMSKNNKST